MEANDPSAILPVDAGDTGAIEASGAAEPPAVPETSPDAEAPAAEVSAVAEAPGAEASAATESSAAPEGETATEPPAPRPPKVLLPHQLPELDHEVPDVAPPCRPEIGHGDFVIVIMPDGKRLTVRAGQGSKGTHFGQLDLVQLIGLRYGTTARTNKGTAVYLVRPSLQDHIMSLKRITQIIYPKDIGTILLKLGIGPGSRVLECGTGSGALTMSMAWMIGNSGRIYSYEREKAHHERARYNLNRIGFLDRVELKLRDMANDRFDERDVDAAFLDVREPPDILPKVTECLAPGGILGFLLPTANQVSDVLSALETAPYIDTEVMETFFRKYKVNANRLRPEDRMIGHTGYLIFTRRIEPDPDFQPPAPRAPKRPASAAMLDLEDEPESGDEH